MLAASILDLTRCHLEREERLADLAPHQANALGDAPARWPKWSAGPLRVQVVAVGVSSASSARNPCRPASCLHANLHSTHSCTAVRCTNSDFTPKDYSPMCPATKLIKQSKALRRSHHLSIDCACQRGLCSNSLESIFSLITFELQPPPGYNATFDETHLGRQHGREQGSSPSKVFMIAHCRAIVGTMLRNGRFAGP